jgi:hypothetical protein
MRRYIGASLLLGLCVGLSAEAAPPDKKRGKADGPPLDSEKLSAGSYAGKLLTVPGSDRAFTVRVDFPETKGRLPRGNPELYQLIRIQNQIAQEQNRMAVSRNPAANLTRIQSLMVQYQREQDRLVARGVLAAKNLKVVNKTRDVDFQTTEKVKVRTMVLPDEFDEKGNVKKRTRAELAKLKGKDKNLPGYESSLEKLEEGQRVRVTLVAVKKPSARPADKDVDKDDAEKKMQVKLIVILKESSDADAPKKGKKK